MTMTDERPAAAAVPPQSTGRQAPAPTTPPPSIDPTLVTELLAAIALTGFSIAVAAGYARVFAGWQFFDNFVVLAIVGHGFGFVTRRLRIPGLVAVPLMIALMGWMIAIVHYRDSMSLLLPTGDTLELFRQEIELVRQQFRTAVAPVIYGGGWDVLAAIGMALTIVLSDTFAFRAFARAEALVPGGVLFVFVAALGADRSRVALATALVFAGVAATVALRAHHGPQRTAVIGSRRSPVRRIVPAALGMAAVVAVAAAFVGPRLPGSDSEPIYETRGGNGGSVTNVVSPLVDIRSRLTNRSNAELFTVRADFESYWRLSALPRFNGTEWGLPERALSRADGELSVAREGATELRQEITITALGEKFVPTAADPIAASPQGGLRWNADSSTLLKTDGDLAAGDTFEIVSASPRFDLAALQAATSTDAGDPIYLELPDNFPSSVGEVARSVTAGSSTPYEAAITLQNWFRSEFDYSLEVQAGHSNNAIEGFLRDRVGYCEQFAGTYAAMMRTLGIPARVAVGFTPGNFNGERYSVLGKNAHAWPEVWFDGLGWVPFEPTPGRGAPGAENYTNVEPEQDATGVDPDSASDESSLDASPDVQVSPQTTVAGPAVTTPDGLPVGPGAFDQFEDVAPGAGAAATDENSSFPTGLLIALALLALALAAPALLRRWRRHQVPSDTAGAIALLWRQSVDDLREIGLRPPASVTPIEHAGAAANAFPVIARPFGSLAAAMTEVSYAPEGSSYPLDECRQWKRQIERAVNDSLSPAARVRRYFTRLS
jgi:transglutaminase-like putative cysteine protease